MRTILVLVHLSGVVGVRRELSVSTAFEHLKAEMGKKDKFGIRSSALQKLLSIQGQRATPQISKELEDVKTILDGSIVDAIELGRKQAQDKVTSIVTKLSDTTNEAVKDKHGAVTNYMASFKCYGEQKGQLENIENNDVILNKNRFTESQLCAAVAGKEPFEATFQSIAFSCDMSASDGCTAEIAELKKRRSAALEQISKSQKAGKAAYDLQVKNCGDAKDTRVAQEKKLSGLNTVFDEKVSECKTRRGAFQSTLCNKLGVSLQKKCAAFFTYNEIVDLIEGKNNSLSEPDRAVEWETTQLASCLLGLYASNVDVDASSVTQCQYNAKSLDERFGQINFKTVTVDDLMMANKFTCKEETLSYAGVWNIPTNPRADSKLYIKDETKSYDVNVDLQQNTIFNVC